MNIFRLVGDLSHLLAVIILVLKIWKTRSCAGISGKSQILFALVYTTRYLDLFTNFISIYNSMMKTVFIVGSYATIFLMYSKFKATYDHNHDTFRIEFLLIPVAGLSLLVNHDFTPLEVLWTFSIYLEAVAILPQLFLVSKTGEAETITSHYLFALGIYRALYILNWVYRYYMEGFFDLIAIVAGIVQTVLYCDFFYLYVTKGKFTNWVILYHGLELLSIQLLYVYYRVATKGENPQISSYTRAYHRGSPLVMGLMFGLLMTFCFRSFMAISLFLSVLIRNVGSKKHGSDIKNSGKISLIK